MKGLEAFDKYFGVQGVLALVLTIAAIIMQFTGRAVPSEMWGLLGVSWGFYFAKNGSTIASDFVNRIQKG